MFRLSYLMAIVPISVLLMVSFFVLLALRKVEEKALRGFGYVVVSLLWLSALVIFSGAVYKMAKGSCPARCMMQQRMSQMPMTMQKDCMSSMAMPEKGLLPKDDKKSTGPKCGGNKGIVFKAE